MNWNVGGCYTARDVCQAFRMGGRVRGIGRSAAGDLCVVTGSRREGSVYRDELHGDEFLYRGEGLRGDQELRRGNRRLAEAVASRAPVHVFRYERRNAYRYLGRAVATRLTWETESDADGVERRVVVFALHMVPDGSAAASP
jgi:hypothetical protein